MAAAVSGGILIATVVVSFGLALGLEWILLRGLLGMMPARWAKKSPVEIRRAA